MSENYFDKYDEKYADYGMFEGTADVPEVEPEPVPKRGSNYFDKFDEKYGDYEAKQPEIERDYGLGIFAAFRRGLERQFAMGDVAQGDYEELAGHYENMKQWQMSEEDIAKFEELRETEGFWRKAGGLMKNPKLVMQVVAESLPMMAAPIVGALGGGVAGGAIGTSVGGPAGTAVGTIGGAMLGGGTGSFFTEYFNAMGDYMQQQGVNPEDPASLKAAFENEQMMSEARSFAAKRGIPIAVFDALSMGLAGRIAKPIAGATRKVAGRSLGAGVISEVGMQASLGAAGEAGAQLASEGEITDELDVLLEGFAEIVPGAFEAGVSKYLDSRNVKEKGLLDPEESPLARLAKEIPISATDIDPVTGKPVPRLDDVAEELGYPADQDALDVQLEDGLAGLKMDIEGQAMSKEAQIEAQAKEAERQKSRNVQMLEMEARRDAQLARQPADVDALSELDEAEAFFQNEVDAMESVKAKGGRWVVGENNKQDFQPFNEREVVIIDRAIERAQKAVEEVRVRREYEQSRTAEKARQEESAYAQRELQAAEEAPGAAESSLLVGTEFEQTPGDTRTADERNPQSPNYRPATGGEATTTGARSIEGEPVDVVGGQQTRDEGQILSSGEVNPAGGRPLTGSLGEALRGAGVVPPDDEGPTGGGGAPVAPERGPDVTPAEARAAEALEADTEALEERAAIREADQPAEPEPTYDEIPYEPIGEAAPEPAVEWANERLADKSYHDQLDRLTSETQQGGGITLIPSKELGVTYEGRTPSQNPAWMQSIIADEKIGRKYVLNTVEKAKAGKRLGAKQQRIIDRMLDEIDNPEGADYYRTAEPEEAPAFELESEQDGVVPESKPEPKAPQQEVDADIGVPGDMFSPGANAQVDLVDESRTAARKEEKEIPLRETSKSDLEALAVETEGLIEKFIEKGETGGGLDQTEILGGIQKLKLHGHPRAADLEQIARDAIAGKGPKPVSDLDTGIPKGTVEQPPATLFSRLPKEEKKIVGEFNTKMYGEKNRIMDMREHVAGEPDKWGSPHLSNRGKQVILDAYNDAQTGAQPAEKYLEEFRNAIAYRKEKGPYKEGMVGSRHDYLEARNIFEGNKKREVSWENVSAVVKKLGIDNVIGVAPKATPSTSGFVIDEDKFNEEGPNTHERVFSATVDKKNRVAIDTKLKREGAPYLTPEEADAQVMEWEEHAIEQGRLTRKAKHGEINDNSNKVIISLFDTTGVWGNPYALAGYDVRALDINVGVDVTEFTTQYMYDMFDEFDGKEIYGVLAACPCTTFSNSSTRWRKDRHENADPVESRKWIEKMWGTAAAEAKNEDGTYTYATPHDYAIALVHKTMQTLEYYRPQFWALENPEGRIETAAGLPDTWRTGFQPHNFGEPYTKRTLLWGNFNEDLPTANVDPVEGSKMHKMSPSEGRQAARAETPEGFSYAFFMANNFLDMDPVERTKKDYWYVAGAIEQAMEAGVTEKQIRDNVYLDMAFEPDEAAVDDAKQTLRDLINKPKPPGTSGGGTTPPPAPSTPEETPTIDEQREASAKLDAAVEGLGDFLTPSMQRAVPSAADTPTRGFGAAWDIPDSAEIEAAASEADPDAATDAQKKAGNYKKGHIKIAGLDVAIENPVGTKRHGNLKLRDHYGYIKRTEGKDGDQVDVFVNPKAAEDFTGDVYVVDQHIDGKFDEHKVMLGYNNMLDARRAYRRNYNKGWKGLHAINRMPLEDFQNWLAEPGANNKPAQQAPLGPESPAFKKWFGKSKVVDKKGKPLMVFHGTQFRKPFEIFEPKGSFGGWNNVGTWFSNQPYHAEIFAGVNPYAEQGAETAQIIPAYLSIKKPFVTTFDNLNAELDQALGEHEFATGETIDKYGRAERTKMETSKVGLFFRDYLKERGYDGIMFENWEGDGKPAQDVYVAFEPEQIKSAYGNKGTYDATNKSMLYSSGKSFANAPTEAWLKEVLKGGSERMGDIPDTVPLNIAVSELLDMQAQREGAPASPATPSWGEIQTAIKPIEDRMPGAPITLLHNYKQAPKGIVKAMQAEGMTEVPAVYDPNSNAIFMFSDKIKTIDEGVRAALHEKTHQGLHEAFGPALEPLLKDIYKNAVIERQADMQEIQDNYKLDRNNAQHQLIMAEELLTHMAENEPQHGMVKRAIAFIRKLLREMGIVQKFTDTDLISIIKEAQGAVSRQPTDQAVDTMIEEEVMVEETGEIFIVEQSSNDLLADVNKRAEICKKVRACL